MDFRQFASDGDFTIAQNRFEVGERFEDPVRRFVENQRGLFVAQRLEETNALRFLCREKASEMELVRGKTGDDERGEKR